MKKLGLLSLLLLMVVAGCEKSDDNMTTTSTNGDMVINNDLNSLSHRMTFDSNPVIYSFTDTQQSDLKSTGATSVSLKVIGEVLPPQYQDETLQASHIRIVDGYAYVSYNTQGIRYLGGADIINIDTPSYPQLISSVVFIDEETNKGKDISSIDVEPKGSGNNNCVWLAGAEEDNDQLQTPAIVERYILNSSNQFQHSDDPKQYFDLPGYVGTDVRFLDNKVYITSGTDGGLTILNNGMNQIDYYELDNARSVDVTSDYVLAMGGNPGALFRPEVFYETVGGAADPEAKSIVRIYNNFALVALGDGGLQCYDLSSATPAVAVSSLPAPEIPEGANSSEYVTNAVSIYKGWVYIANGAGGLQIAKLDSDGQLRMMGNIDLGASVNFVEAHCNYAFVATGLGGLKIIEMTFNY